MKRAQCLIVKKNRILMVKQKEGNFDIWLLPGGNIEENELPEDASLRELQEECQVDGKIKRLVSFNDYSDRYQEYTYAVDIGDQIPKLGTDPELADDEQNLIDIGWIHPLDLNERERILLWAAGLMSVESILIELDNVLEKS